ncbi:hypothetical protein D3C72_1963300 [compost metagenome]
MGCCATLADLCTRWINARAAGLLAGSHVSSAGCRRTLGACRSSASILREAGSEAYQAPVFGMESQGSAGARLSPFCRISIEMPSGERTKAMWPSRGGRLMVTPWSINRWQIA